MFLIYMGDGRCEYNQMQQYFENMLPRYQCGFHNGYNLQQCYDYDDIKIARKCR